MEEAPENGMESPQSAHAKGMNGMNECMKERTCHSNNTVKIMWNHLNDKFFYVRDGRYISMPYTDQKYCNQIK
jgi:hypothetical protein